MWTDLELALAIVDEAAKVAVRAFDVGAPTVWHKDDGSEVTETDLAIEDLVRERLRRAVPGDGVVGEERPPHQGASGRRWLVDPIGGTADFVRGRPTYSIDLAMEDEHGPALAVSALPSLGRTMAAARGFGCRVLSADGESTARVSTRSRPDEARVCLHGKAVVAHGVVVDNTNSVLRLITGEVDVVLATGVTDPLDVACLPVLVEEAGGRCTDLGDGTVLATNAALHDVFLALVRHSPNGSSD